MRFLSLFAFFCISVSVSAQNVLTPDLLWQLGRVSAIGLTKDKQSVIYKVSTPDVSSNNSSTKTYKIPINGTVGEVAENYNSLLNDKNISPDGKYVLTSKEVKVVKVFGSDFYPELTKSNVQIYDNLMIRHWDQWEDGKFNHVFFAPTGKPDEAKDIMPGEPYDTPTQPFGGDDDFIWSPNSKQIIYVCKKKFGRAYAESTNTDLYAYDIESGKTANLTEGMMGYDLNPSFSTNGALAWLSMKRDGYEADKQDIVVMKDGKKVNLTAYRDDIHVSSYKWSDDGNYIYFVAPINGTEQLFSVKYNGNNKPEIKQITKGDFDITGIMGQSGNTLVVSRTDMNHAAELYTVDILSGAIKQLTYINDAMYATIKKSKTERRFVKTTDGKDMLVWVIYPPDFDPNKKYPTLLYCQGGPQSALTQFYSFRWNFQLMAANGYIIVAPNRRGMPGHGTKWNEQISKDWGGQVMKDYLSAIDAVSKEKFVDKNRLGAIGASYGGYSVFFLAGIHNNRFKTFIAHDGVFDLRSMYGTTEELWFVNWDGGGNYWNKKNLIAQNTYVKFSPSNFADKWNTPILIYQGGKDYRVPIEQGLQAFTAAQVKGIKSRLVYLPDENHWVLQAQNALVWQREFYRWLKETLE
jgi:dipeptidyl aminopeptidase/acylaminoacyl peptidase